MLTLCGFAVSNYYNKVKLALLEKGVAFEEKLVWPDYSPAYLEKTPLGKVPFLETEHGTLIESQVIVNYIEAIHPQPALLPADPFGAARVQQLITVLDVHLELVVRELYGEAFFGGKVSDEVKARCEKLLKKNIAAFGKLASFSPFVAGDQFTLADCAAVFHLPLLGQATKKIYGQNMLADLPVADYLARMEERPHVHRCNVDRKENMAGFIAFHSA